MTPTEVQLRVLRNLAAGRSFEHGFVHEESAMRAMYQCLLAGWVSRNELTDDGRIVLDEYTPVAGNFTVTVVAIGDKPV